MNISNNSQQYIPSLAEIDNILDCWQELKTKGKAAYANCSPKAIARRTRDLQKLLKRLFISMLIGWDELTEALKIWCPTIGQNPQTIKIWLEAIATKEHETLQDLFNQAKPRITHVQSLQDTPAYFVKLSIRTPTGKLTPAKLTIDSSVKSRHSPYSFELGDPQNWHNQTKQDWYNDAYFADTTAAQAFISNLKKARLPIPIAAYTIGIISAGGWPPSEFEEVDTIYGPALIHKKNSAYHPGQAVIWP